MKHVIKQHGETLSTRHFKNIPEMHEWQTCCIIQGADIIRKELAKIDAEPDAFNLGVFVQGWLELGCDINVYVRNCIKAIKEGRKEDVKVKKPKSKR